MSDEQIAVIPLDRLWNLPPVGPPRRQGFEPRKAFAARRHDGTGDGD